MRIPVDTGSPFSPGAGASQTPEGARRVKEETADPSTSTPSSRDVPSRERTLGTTRSQLADVLRDAPGARARADGAFGGAARVSARGVESAPPAFLFEGVPLAGAFSGEENVELLPAVALGRVTLHPHVAPWDLPRGGIAGTFDLGGCTREKCLPPGAHSRLGALGGSYGYAGASALRSGTFRDGNLDTFAAAQFTRGDDDYPYTDDANTLTRTDDDFRSRRRNNDFARASALARATWRDAPGGVLDVVVAGGREERGLPGPAGGRSDERLARSLVLARAEHRAFDGASGVERRVVAYHVDNRSRRRDGALPSVTTSTDDLRFSNSGARAVLVAPFEAGLGGVFGWAAHLARSDLSGASPRGLSGGEARLEATRQTRQFTLYRDATWRTAEFVALAASLDATLDTARTRSRVDCTFAYGSEDCGGGVSAEEEPLFTFNGTLRAHTASRGELPEVGVTLHAFATGRRPSLLETYGNSAGVIPNLALAAESTRGGEVGLSLHRAEGSCYLARDSDLIVAERVDPRRARHENVGRARRRGCLFEAWAPWTGAWGTFEARGRYSWLKAEALSPDGVFPLPRSPRHRATGRLGLRDMPLGFARLKAAAFHETTWESVSTLDANARVRLEPRPMQDAGVALAWTAQAPATVNEVRLAFSVLNLGDARSARERVGSASTASVEHAGFVGYPLPGRRFLTTLEATF